MSAALIGGGVYVSGVDWWWCVCQWRRFVVVCMSAALIGGGVYVSDVD